MASYLELNDLLELNEGTKLRQRVAVATLKAADAIRKLASDGTDAVIQAKKRFAQRIFKEQFNQKLIFRQDDSALVHQPTFESVYRMVLTDAPDAATVEQITGVSDPDMQTKVDVAVAFLAAEYPNPPVTP